MEHTREETLTALADLGIEVTQHRVSLNLIDRKLSKALEYSQRLSSFLKPNVKLTTNESNSAGEEKNTENSSKLNPTKLKSWKSVSTKSLEKASGHSNMQEASTRYLARQHASGGNADPFPLGSNAFMDLRQTVMGMGRHFDTGLRAGMLQDREKTSRVIFRMIDVFALSEDDPMFVIAYVHAIGPLSSEHEDYLASVARRSAKRDLAHTAFQIFSTIAEQKLFLKLVNDNRKRLDAEYRSTPPLTNTEKKLGFKISFIVPPSPLSMVDIGSLTNERGCESCGEKAERKCSGCLSVAYCGKECQVADWPHHKHLCKSLSSGAWVTLRFFTDNEPLASDTSGQPQVTSRLRFNRYTSLKDLTGEKFSELVTHTRNGNEDGDDTASAPVPPPNPYGDRPFLIKIQRALDGNPDILIYDRKRVFQVNVAAKGSKLVPVSVVASKSANATGVDASSESDSDSQTGPGIVTSAVFSTVADEMAKRGYMGIKMYRWAKRTSDWEISVCLDRQPREDVQW